MHARWLTIICGVLMLLTALGCNREQLPADPGVAAGDLGVGIRLGMPVDEARGQSAVGAEYWVITRDEMVSRSPYNDKPAGKDLVVALYTEYPAGPAGMSLKLDFGQITEIRCYLGETKDSPVTLLGNPAAGLSPDGVRHILGEPVESSQGSDGNTHLTYRFANVDAEGKTDHTRVIRLTTSHNSNGNCFALLAALDRVD